MFDNFNLNLRENKGFLTYIPHIPIPEYGQSNAPLDVLFEKEGLQKDPTLEEWKDFEKWWNGNFWPHCLVHSMAKLPILGFNIKVKKTWKINSDYCLMCI